MKTNIKMRVTPEQSEAIQEIVFANGGRWYFSGQRIAHKDAPFIFIDGSFEMSYCSDIDSYNPTTHEEVDADLFIRTNGTLEERKGDPHAENMLEYAKDATKTDKPWELWQVSGDDVNWDDLMGHPGWNENLKYRRKLKTITMPDGTVLPEPVRERLEEDEEYYCVNLSEEGGYLKTCWKSDEIDLNLLGKGMVHKTKENVVEWHNYFTKLTKGNE